MASKYQVIDIVGSVPLLGRWKTCVRIDWMFVVMNLPRRLWEGVIRREGAREMQKERV